MTRSDPSPTHSDIGRRSATHEPREERLDSRGIRTGFAMDSEMIASMKARTFDAQVYALQMSPIPVVNVDASGPVDDVALRVEGVLSRFSKVP